MHDIFGREIHVGDLIMVAYGSSPEVCIITHRSRAGNLMSNLFANVHTKGGKFVKGRYTISSSKQVILIPIHAIPPVLLDDYNEIINDPKLVRR